VTGIEDGSRSWFDDPLSGGPAPIFFEFNTWPFMSWESLHLYFGISVEREIDAKRASRTVQIASEDTSVPQATALATTTADSGCHSRKRVKTISFKTVQYLPETLSKRHFITAKNSPSHPDPSPKSSALAVPSTSISI
jgi:hypothetical protein